MIKWQPIETAPKDGSAVLVYAEREGWRGNHRIVCAKWGGLGDVWSIYGCGATKHSDQWLDQCIPTHWMPLPPPPTSVCEHGKDK